MIKIELVTIKELPMKELSNTINKWMEHKLDDYSLFLAKSDKGTYISVDNEAGECFVEEFDTKNKALCWLLRKDYGADEIEKLSEQKVSKLISKIKHEIVKPKGIEYGI